MSVWEPRERQKFLKAVGSSDDPMAADWMDSAPQEMSVIHFARQPASVRVDDYLVYYAAGWGKLIGVVRVFAKPAFDAQLGRWPYVAPIRPLLMIRDFSRAPAVDVLNVAGGRDFRRTVMQMDYALLEDAEYERAALALRGSVDVSRGDFLEGGLVPGAP
ncbi:MAG: hypothetical protein R3C15_19620 [Thermoleophilia bacterium]